MSEVGSKSLQLVFCPRYLQTSALACVSSVLSTLSLFCVLKTIYRLKPLSHYSGLREWIIDGFGNPYIHQSSGIHPSMPVLSVTCTLTVVGVRYYPLGKAANGQPTDNSGCPLIVRSQSALFGTCPKGLLVRFRPFISGGRPDKTTSKTDLYSTYIVRVSHEEQGVYNVGLPIKNI